MRILVSLTDKDDAIAAGATHAGNAASGNTAQGGPYVGDNRHRITKSTNSDGGFFVRQNKATNGVQTPKDN